MTHRRILVVDDNPAIHDDVRKILAVDERSDALADTEALLFGDVRKPHRGSFSIDSAYQSAEGVERVRAALAEGRPYALALVDMRMPPGDDGLTTIERVWKVDPAVQVVMCTAYSDSRWEDVAARLGATDQLLILKKPYDAAELLQLVWALSEKWRLAQESMRQNDELSRSLALARSIQDAVVDGILVVDEHRRVVNHNQRFVEMWKLPQEILDTHDDQRLIQHVVDGLADPNEFLSRVTYLYAHPDEVANEEVGLKDGRTFERWSGPVRGGGRELGRIWCFRDISERKKIESERAVLTERLTSIGRVAASVGHEINNPLSYVMANVDHIAESLSSAEGDEAPTRESLLEVAAEARSGLARIRLIVRDLQTLTRSDEESLGPVDVSGVLDRSIQIAGNQLRHRARVVRDYQPVGDVWGNEARLGQVFLNLMLNAAQAIPEGQANKNFVTVRLRQEDEAVVVEILDTGSGIEPANLQRIFDPFFTTKPVGSGTGLGLSICKGIIERHHGTITVRSRRGEGTCFTVGLPASRAFESSSSSIAAVKPVRPRRKVLIIDDEPMIASALSRMMRKSHDVECMSQGAAALTRLKQGETFDVIFCDVMMPDVTGLDIHAELTSFRPELAQRLVFMTGGAFTDQAIAYLAKVPNFSIEKPFSRPAMEAAIDRVLTSVGEVAATPALCG
jgi:signal transduction histidine kinase